MSNWLYRAYTVAGSGLVLLGLPPFFLYTRLSGRYGGHLEERLGCLPPWVKPRMTGAPRIWLHAVSLGEVAAARAIVEELREKSPACSVILSTTTEHGRKMAKETLGDVPVVYSPIDFIGSVRKALLHVRPHVLGLLETEIWPAWLIEARRLGIRTAIINGRLSVRSIHGYSKFRPFFREVLDNVDAFSMISDSDADRMTILGAPPEKVTVNGNAKFDVLQETVDTKAAKETRAVLNLRSSQAVFVAGSTRGGEEEILLDAYDKIRREIPDIIFVMAPRHINRIANIVTLIQSRGIAYQLWDDLASGGAQRKAPVVLVDTFGVLSKIYSSGTIVFCGGSLVPMGGQNPLEAAVCGKIVFYGPSMEDFQDARALLEGVGAGIEVLDADQLARKALWFYRHPERLSSLGRAAKKVVLRNGGAAERHAEVLCKLAYKQ